MGAITRNKFNSNPSNKKLRQNGTQKKQKHKGHHPNKTDLKLHTKLSNTRKEVQIAETLNLSKVIKKRKKSKRKNASNISFNLENENVDRKEMIAPKSSPVDNTQSPNKRKQRRKNKLYAQDKNIREPNKGDDKIQEIKGSKGKIQPKRFSKSGLTKQNQQNSSKTKLKKLKLATEKEANKNKRHTHSSSVTTQQKNNDSQVGTKTHKLNINKLQEMLAIKEIKIPKKQKIVKPVSLRERMMARLRASRFRYLNETLYNNESSESKKYFKDDPDAFMAYHDGYKQQIDQWPVNPLDVIISSIKKMPKENIIADFGCGEARLSSSVAQKVHSFDFVSLNERVTVCDMAHTPLLMGAVNVVVFCLSLMGTNLNDYLIEANRVLKKDGILKIAEVESRFEKVEEFVSLLGEYGFTNTWTDLSHNLFYFLDFKKTKDIGGNKNKLPPVTLKTCLYKKR